MNNYTKEQLLKINFKEINENVKGLLLKKTYDLKILNYKNIGNNKIDDVFKNKLLNTPIKNLRLYLESTNYKEKINEIQSKFDKEFKESRNELKALIQVMQEMKENPKNFQKQNKREIERTKEKELLLINHLNNTNIVNNSNVKEMKENMIVILKDEFKTTKTIDKNIDDMNETIDDINETINKYSFDR